MFYDHQNVRSWAVFQITSLHGQKILVSDWAGGHNQFDHSLHDLMGEGGMPLSGAEFSDGHPQYLMPVTQSSTGDGSLEKLLSSGTAVEGDERLHTMDVLLDTCWAVISEIGQCEGASAHLKAFKDNCS